MTAIWYSRDALLGTAAEEGWAVTAYEGDAHPDGAIVERAEPVEPFLWRTSATRRGILHFELGEGAVDDAPPLWFVMVDEPRATPVACNIVAFASEHFEPGTVVSNYTFASAQVPNELQVGALRWYRGDGLVHQVFVAPDWRRRHAGSAIIYAASGLHQSMGWPGKLHGDGRRTDLGQLFVAASRHPDRIAPLSDQMPPMDPS